MGYSGILPQAIKGNRLIEEGRRLSKSVPQLPFINKLAPKIERAGVVKRLSPSMNKNRTFVSRKPKPNNFNYMGSDIIQFSNKDMSATPPPMPYPYYPYPPQPMQSMQSMPNQARSPVYVQSPPVPADYYRNYQLPMDDIGDPRLELSRSSEARKRIGEGRGLSNVALNTSRETRQWLNTGNSVAREARGTLRYLKIKPEDLGF